MFFKKKTVKQILSIPDDFFNIVSVDRLSNTVVADLYYSVNQYAAIKQEALTVTVNVISKKPKIESIITADDNQIDSKKVIQKLSTHIRDIAINSKNQEKFIVAKRNSDITSKINNEIIPFLKTGNSKDAPTRTVIKPQLVERLKNEGSVVPNISITNSYMPVSSSTTQNESKKVINNLLFKEQKDPSSFITDFNISITPAESRDGFSKQNTNNVSFNVSKLSSIMKSSFLSTKKNLGDFFDNDYIDVLTTEKQIDLSIPIRIILPINSTVDGIDKSNYLFKFDLISSKTKLSIDTITKEVELFKHIKFFTTPKLAPTVKVSNSTTSRVILDIIQNDENANSVNIYKKTISKATSNDSEYLLLGNFETGGLHSSTLVRLSNENIKSTVLFRVIPTNNGNEGFEFSNVVISSNKDLYLKNVSLSTYSEQSGIRVEARNLPPDLVSIKFVSKNLSLLHKDFSIVNDEVILINDVMKSNDYVSVVDSSVKDNNIYEYNVCLIFSSGIEVVAGSSIIEHAARLPQGLSTRVENISQQENDFSFSITTKSFSSNLDIVLQLLRKQNIDAYFTNEVFAEKEKLASLIAHNVQRVDLETGKRYDFGIILEDSFVESSYRELNNIDPINSKKKYRYEVTAVIRDPETIFESEQEKTDKIIKKQYRFSPLKFKHPINKRSGMLVTANGISLKHSKNTFMYGMLGNTINIDVGIDKLQSNVRNLKADIINRDYAIISWTFEDLFDVDHFVVFAETSGTNFAVGKVHSNFQNNFCYFMHKTSKHSFNATRYAVLPIYKAYDIGTLEYSNLLNR
jgi:hypothetical protein